MEVIKTKEGKITLLLLPLNINSMRYNKGASKELEDPHTIKMQRGKSMTLENKITIELTPEEAFDLLTLSKNAFCVKHGINIYHKLKRELEDPHTIQITKCCCGRHSGDTSPTATPFIIGRRFEYDH